MLVCLGCNGLLGLDFYIRLFLGNFLEGVGGIGGNGLGLFCICIDRSRGRLGCCGCQPVRPLTLTLHKWLMLCGN